jgi:hypothetical protein
MPVLITKALEMQNARPSTTRLNRWTRVSFVFPERTLKASIFVEHSGGKDDVPLTLPYVLFPAPTAVFKHGRRISPEV